MEWGWKPYNDTNVDAFDNLPFSWSTHSIDDLVIDIFFPLNKVLLAFDEVFRIFSNSLFGIV